ncbi:twin-arginine translocase subunit TatC [Nocardioides ultimimeridianus]
MSLSGVVSLLVGKPVHPVSADGRMALSDHLRELRARVLKSALILALGFVAAIFFYHQLLQLVTGPYDDARRILGDDRTDIYTSGAAGGFMLFMKLTGLAALVGTSPFWLYQIWAFILPGLHAHERKWSHVFMLIAGPLFLVGIVVGYVTLPKGLQILIGFNPHDVHNLVEFNEYLSFFSRTLLTFGIAFEIPVFVVLLNLAGIVKGSQLGAYRSWIIVGTFIFAAAATPSTDPFTMTIMAVPMCLLFGISEVIARLNDRRRGRQDLNDGLSPDEMSEI